MLVKGRSVPRKEKPKKGYAARGLHREQWPASLCFAKIGSLKIICKLRFDFYIFTVDGLGETF